MGLQELKVPYTPSEMSHGIRDNRAARGTVADFLLSRVRPDSDLSVVSAYFTVHAYWALSQVLDGIRGMRFLFGDPASIQAVDAGKTASKAFQISDHGLSIAQQLQQRALSQRCARWIEERVEIRASPQGQLIHGKLYHINDGRREHAIVGSSNMTMRGLGFSKAPNIELNLVVDGDRDRAELRQWFDELWDRSIDVKGEVIEYIRKVYGDRNPEFVYYKTLFHVFNRSIDDQADAAKLFASTEIVDTEIWKALFDFQRDGVKGAIRKIQTYSGCILADSVGLGKTYSALAVIKYFELRNHRVLVLCPKKLRDNWTVYLAQNNSELNPFVRDRFAYTVLSHTDLSRDQGKVDGVDLATLSWGNYDLIVIDESHNFRNDTRGQRDEAGNVIRKSRYERLMEDVIKAGVKTKVLLLSATPVNNDLKDLRNQLELITEQRDDAFAQDIGVPSVRDTLKVAQKTFTAWATHGAERDVRTLLERLPAGLFALLDALTIARSRKHIERFYPESLARIGRFPKRLPPEKRSEPIDLDGTFPTYDAIHDNISQFQLSLYTPSSFVREEHRDQYLARRFREQGLPGFDQGKHEQFLIGMMRVNFLKRLESSVRSFAITMRRTVEKIEGLLDKLRRFSQRAEGALVERPDAPDQDDEELQEAFAVGAKYQYDLRHMKVDEWTAALSEDRDRLASLAAAAEAVNASRDAKLAELWKIIDQKLTAPTTNRRGEANRKVIVFCAFADTAAYLYEHLAPRVRERGAHAALVSGGAAANQTTFGRADFAEILTHFSPRSKRREKMGTAVRKDAEIDVLIATDCISEGQNLQDCDLLINYDIHWNPVRIIQRFGRIDRLGSLNDAVRLLNFWPTDDLNKYINLKNRVEARMALVDVAATAGDNLLQNEDIEALIHEDLKYRDKQLKRLKDEVLDLEDFSDTVSLGDFSLDDFRTDLASYLEKNRAQLAAAPFGLYAVVPPHPDVREMAPGVVFCLKQRGDAPAAETVNPTQPYYLAYVRDNGDVRFNFTHPKQVLEIFRALCQGKASAYEDLCRVFDRETRDGDDMSRYSTLLDAAVRAIVARFERKHRSGLFAGRGAKLLDAAQRVSGADDFELVTWLVIHGGEVTHAA